MAWIAAGLWAIVASSGLLIGAILGWFVPFPRRIVAAVMAFGSGVLISAVASQVMEESFARGGLWAAISGMLIGGMLFTGINKLLARHGAKHRKRSDEHQRLAREQGHGAMAIAVGAFLDGIPESLLLGLSLLEQGTISVALLLAFFLSNIPEGLSSSAGMRRAQHSARYTFSVWIIIMLLSGGAAVLGYVIFSYLSPFLIAGTSALAGVQF